MATYQQAYIEAHNDRRRLHCSQPLKWSADLEQEAKTMAKTIDTKAQDASGVLTAISPGVSTKFGPTPSDDSTLVTGKEVPAMEKFWGPGGKPPPGVNVYIGGQGTQVKSEFALEQWYDLQHKNYDPTYPTGPGTSEFQNVVWKESKQMGMWVEGNIHVAIYRPPGNTGDLANHQKNIQTKSYTCGEDPDPDPVDSATEPWKQEVVNEHNRKRERHCAPKLIWSQECYNSAKKAADEMQARGSLYHNNAFGPSGQHGQNYFKRDNVNSVIGPIVSWYDEVEKYDFNSPGLQYEAGHFTQLVWKETKMVGMATSSDGMYAVANYLPPGNVNRPESFKKNVLPVGCKESKGYDDYQPSPKKRKTSSGCDPCAGYRG